MQEDLLDAAARMAGCTFLSDLRLAENHGKVIQALRALSADRYSPQEWQEAACYLLLSQDSETF